MCQSNDIQPATYVLAECRKEIEQGEHYGPEDIKELIQGDASRQAEFIFWANIGRLLADGKNVMLITNPSDEFVFPGIIDPNEEDL